MDVSPTGSVAGIGTIGEMLENELTLFLIGPDIELDALSSGSCDQKLNDDELDDDELDDDELDDDELDDDELDDDEEDACKKDAGRCCAL